MKKKMMMNREVLEDRVLEPTPLCNSSGVYICKSVVNYLRHGNFICKSEGIYLEDRVLEPVGRESPESPVSQAKK